MSGTELPDRADIVVVGGGIAGASLAYYLARLGAKALVLDRNGPAAGASGANAGMVGSSAGIPGSTLPLTQLTAQLYRQATTELASPFGYHQVGRLLLATSPEELAPLEQFVQTHRQCGVNTEMCYGREIQEIEPRLSNKVLAAAYMPDDGKIDPLKATVAFLNAACRHGASFKSGHTASELVLGSRRVRGVRCRRHVIKTDRVVIAGGAWSAGLVATAGVELPVFPGRGQMLVTEPCAPLSPFVLRATMIGLRQFDEGHLAIGSEVEKDGFNTLVTAATIARYSAFIRELVPSAAPIRVERVWSGLRPMTPDNLPIVGPVPGIGGLDLLTGHGRSGMTEGPATALALAEVIVGGKTTIPLQPFDPARFAI